eukprot:g3425.t1
MAFLLRCFSRRTLSSSTSQAMRTSIRSSPYFKENAFVDGQWLDANDKKKFDVVDPATNLVLGQVPDMGEAETDAAIAAAQAAMPAWKAMTAKDRAVILERWQAIMLEQTEAFAQIITAESGKPLAEARGEVAYGASFAKWFAEEGKRAYGDIIPEPLPGRKLMTIMEPVGVCSFITPWNFPLAMITRKAAPALAAGCGVVLKPSEETPYTALACAVAAEEAGVPKGLFNVVTASRSRTPEVGKALTTNKTVKKFSFTGSTATGKLLAAQCAGTVKKVSLELGGNAPFIVFNDADLEAAVQGVMDSKFRNTGQTCVCANRIYVHDDVYDAFSSMLAKRVGEMKLGHGGDEGVTAGPLINDAGREKVEEHVKDALSKGARIVCGGELASDVGESGNFYHPTVLAEVTSDMKCTFEETFGPVAPLFRFKDEKDVIAQANAVDAGLAAYFYSQDVSRVFRVSQELEYGIVGANAGIISTEVAPFGGVKESGLGREGSHHGLSEFMEVKYICVGGLL